MFPCQVFMTGKVKQKHRAELKTCPLTAHPLLILQRREVTARRPLKRAEQGREFRVCAVSLCDSHVPHSSLGAYSRHTTQFHSTAPASGALSMQSAPPAARRLAAHPPGPSRCPYASAPRAPCTAARPPPPRSPAARAPLAPARPRRRRWRRPGHAHYVSGGPKSLTVKADSRSSFFCRPAGNVTSARARASCAEWQSCVLCDACRCLHLVGWCPGCKAQPPVQGLRSSGALPWAALRRAPCAAAGWHFVRDI